MENIIVSEQVIDTEIVESKPQTDRERWIAGLRDMAKFFEEHPELPMPLSTIQLCLFPKVEEMRKYVHVFGKARKETLGDAYFCLNKVFYEDQYQKTYVQATWTRDNVCERVKTGTKKVMQTVQVEPAKTIQVETEVETFEWKCPKVAALHAELIEGQ